MEYDPTKVYSSSELRCLSSEELLCIFEKAKKEFFKVGGRLLRKVRADIATIRILVKH